MIAIAAAAAFFGCVAFIGIALSRSVCAGIAPAEDGPAPGKVPIVALVGGAAVLGGVLMASHALALQLGIAAIAVFALAACWYSDATCGIVPDLFTLAPLAALLFFAVAQRDWMTIISAAVIFVPFALVALVSRGYGMGWGDAKLVALCGAVLGAPIAFLALSLACGLAVIVHRVAGAAKSPIAFAPYIAAATAIAIPLGLVH
jgi:prepilin signal peptidase PulO-like enzyme (type II secretory pathway)